MEGKGKRLVKLTGKVAKGFGRIGIAGLALAVARDASKNGVDDVRESSRQIYNILINSVKKW